MGEYRKSLEVNASLAKPPTTKTIRTHSNHVLRFPIYAFAKLERMKPPTEVGHLALRPRTYLKAVPSGP